MSNFSAHDKNSGSGQHFSYTFGAPYCEGVKDGRSDPGQVPGGTAGNSRWGVNVDDGDTPKWYYSIIVICYCVLIFSGTSDAWQGISVHRKALAMRGSGRKKYNKPDYNKKEYECGRYFRWGGSNTFPSGGGGFISRTGRLVRSEVHPLTPSTYGWQMI